MDNGPFEITPDVGGGLFSGSHNSPAGLNRQRWGKITGSAGSGPVRYSWDEQTPEGLGFVKSAAGITSTTGANPVVEPNGRVLAVGDIVKVRAGYFDPIYDWVYFVEGWTGSGSGLNHIHQISPLAQGVRTTRDSPQTIPDNVWTAINFNVDRWNVSPTGGWHSTTVNNERITLPTAGLLFGARLKIGGHVAWAANSVGVRGVRIRRDASEIIAANVASNVGALDQPMSISTYWDVVDVEYFVLEVFQNSGGDLDIQKVDAYSPEFWADTVVEGISDLTSSGIPA